MPRVKEGKDNLHIEEGAALVPSEKGEVIAREYLDECGCSQSLQGYFILTKVICFAAQFPAATSRELFKRYIDCFDDSGAPREKKAEKAKPGDKKFLEGEWHRIYNMARYCFLKAENPGGRDFFSFIRLGASRIYKDVYLKNGQAAGGLENAFVAPFTAVGGDKGVNDMPLGVPSGGSSDLPADGRTPAAVKAE